MRIAATVHAAWSISKTTASTMIPRSQAELSVANFERNGAPTRLNLARQTVQPRYERRIGYRRCTAPSSEGRPCFRSELVEDDSICVIGDNVGSPACDTNFYGFMIDRLSADKQLFLARYTFEITLPGHNDFEVLVPFLNRIPSLYQSYSCSFSIVLLLLINHIRALYQSYSTRFLCSLSITFVFLILSTDSVWLMASYGVLQIFFEGCCRLTESDMKNNNNLPFYLSTQVQMRFWDCGRVLFGICVHPGTCCR